MALCIETGTIICQRKQRPKALFQTKENSQRIFKNDGSGSTLGGVAPDLTHFTYFKGDEISWKIEKVVRDTNAKDKARIKTFKACQTHHHQPGRVSW